VAVVVANPQQVAGLRAAYGFEEGAGSAAADASGNGNTGTLSGPAWTPAGRSGGALSFDGVNDLVTVPDANSLDLSGAMTVEAWVYPTASSGWRTAVMKEAANDIAYALYASGPDGPPEGYVGSSAVTGSGALTLNAWTHLAVTYDGAMLRLYQNGAQVGTRSLGGPIAATNRALQIGGNAIWGEYFSGRIDEVRVYDRALTPAEIAADMDAPVVQEPQPARSSPIAVDAAARRVWVVNPDNDSVTALGADSLAVELEVPVGRHPTSLALDGFGQVWVTCRDDDAIWILGAQSGAVLQTLTLPWGSAPIGVVFAPGGADGYVAAYGSGRIHRVHAITQALGASLAIGPTPRALAVTGDGARLYATQFISTDGVGRVRSVDLATFTPAATVQMPLDTTSLDGSVAARGLPNYLAGIAIAPGSGEAWVAAKKDNVLRGLARDGQPLTFETTVRALVGVLDLGLGQEVVARRIDADNQSQPSAVAFSESGNHALVTLQGNDRLIAYNALGLEVVRADTGRAPQGVAIDPATQRVFTHDFMSRTVSVFDGAALLTSGTGSLPRIAQVTTVSAEALAPDVLRGKQIFYGAGDTRMSRDGYISCASCHIDGDQDGQVWDFTDRGEGLRNTISLRGQGGSAGAPLHWTGNFDEVQDFEGDIRSFFGGTGLMSDADYFAGTRWQPLGAAKAGLSSDLDALAAYVDSLTETPRSPARQADGSMTPDAVAGQALFESSGCGSCHAGPRFSDSPTGARHDVGTIQPSSGFRLGGPLDGFDTPMLPGLAASAPYLHDGSAATVRDVLTSANPNGEHGALGSLTPAQIDQLAAYLLQLELSGP
jgi:DNA-binding beta-propeller fold protein YncE